MITLELCLLVLGLGYAVGQDNSMAQVQANYAQSAMRGQGMSNQLYDRYFGTKLSDKRRGYLNPVLDVCTVYIEPCNPKEGRRVDGTCNNLKWPTRGAGLSPMFRMLPAMFGPGNTLRAAKDGSQLPSARRIRVTTFPDNQEYDHKFSSLLPAITAFATLDVAKLTDILTYAIVSECCPGNQYPPEPVSPRCIPIEVTADDPIYANTDIRCMNLTRHLTFQDLRCIPNTLPAERADFATPVLDLSIIYGNFNMTAAQTRQYQGGLLREEIRNGRRLPPGRSVICVNNRPPNETECYEYGDELGGNILPNGNLISLFFFRNHNRMARILSRMNPCWDDEKLYQEARRINIAEFLHTMYYEAIPPLIGGKKPLLEAGVIYDTEGYVEDYDPHLEPALFHEYILGTRWFHEFQEGRMNRYDPRGKFIDRFKVPNILLRAGVLEVNRTMEELTQGLFREPAAKFDWRFDPEYTQRLFGGLQRASDLPAIDFQRGRDTGMPPYNDYREVCGMKRAKDFEDFEEMFGKERAQAVELVYNDPDDVDFMVGIYAEKWVKGGFVGPTLACVMKRQLLYWRQSDRFFYERKKQPTPFTPEQLKEIRKFTAARLLCDNGDEVDEIQANAYFKINKENPVKSCKEIQDVDLSKFKDPKCNSKYKGDDDDYYKQYY